MTVVNIEVSKCAEGDVAAADVISDNGIILVTKDTCLNIYIKSRLMDMGISHICIYCNTMRSLDNNDPTYSKYERSYKDTVLSMKQIVNSITSGKKLDFSKVAKVSEQVFESMQGCSYITKCMNEIHNIDEYTYYHCVNVAFYSMLIGKWLGRSKDEIFGLILAGLLHDIGKIKISNKILNKNGSLSNEEYEIVKNHTVFGYGLLNEVEEISIEVKRAALLHHERVDRSGYPFNASTEALGLYAKVVAIADVFDAMTSDRVYKKRDTPFNAFEMFITIGIGSFDPIILSTFLKNIAKYYIGSNVVLNSGEKGKIVYIPPHDILSPIVETNSGYLDLSLKGSPKIQNLA
jgi:putative nucleotidyltransferase with HDIG domain